MGAAGCVVALPGAEPVTVAGIATAVVDLNGHLVRAHVAASQIFEAVDLVTDSLERRVRRYESRLHQEPQDDRPTVHEWRHGDRPEQRPTYFPLPRDEREIVRRKTFDATPMTVVEAASELDRSGHDFFLFREAATSAPAVVSFDSESGSLRLQRPEGTSVDGGADATGPARLGPPAPRLEELDAVERLEAGGERYVFYIDSDTGDGTVAYHRYDGNWGVITSRV